LQDGGDDAAEQRKDQRINNGDHDHCRIVAIDHLIRMVTMRKNGTSNVTNGDEIRVVSYLPPCVRAAPFD
jgi:hypothetical protein